MIDLFGEFRDLLAPMSIDEFVESYWEKRPVYIPGPPDKFRGLFDLDSFFRIIGEARPGPDLRRPRFNAGYRDARGEHQEMDILSTQIPSLMDAGMTIQARALESIDPRLRALCMSARRALGLAVEIDAACFFSPPGGGFGLHFDGNDVWALQIEGTKVWRYSRAPAVDFPQQAYVPRDYEIAARIHHLDESTHIEQTLKPGDLLYLPAGTWHRPTAVEQSVHLSLAVYQSNVLALVSETLSPGLLANSNWRHLPSSPIGGRDIDVEAYFNDRLDEFRSVVAELTSTKLVDMWRKRVARSSPNRDSPSSAICPVTEEQRLVLVHPLRIALEVNEQQDQLLLLSGSTVIGTLPSDALDFARALGRANQFVAREAMLWTEGYGWDDVSELLTELLQLGVLRTV